MKRLIFLVSISFGLTILHAKERVDLVSYCVLLMPEELLLDLRPDISSIDSFPMIYQRVNEAYDFRATHYSDEYVRNFYDEPNLKKIVYYEYCMNEMQKLPQSKLVLFKWEANKINPALYDRYSLVYTIDDDLIDGKKFLKFYYPALLPMLQERTPFHEKKLCTMVVTNWTEERLQILDFFETKPAQDFEFYGGIGFPYFLSERYRGGIPGYHSGIDKIQTLNQYRFGICFENSHTTRGYITEKIFNYFAAGTIPVYWGPENILDYIPKDCFIDYRNFSSNEEMYQFIKNMNEWTYYGYIERIAVFLNSLDAQLFSPDFFDKTLLDAVTRNSH